MTSFVRLIVLASAIVFLGGAGVASAQVIIVIDPPPGCPDVNATLKITKQPVANNLQQVTMEFKWGNNTGIKEVKVRMLKKDGDGNYTVEVGTETIATMQATGSRVNKLFPAAA